MGIVVNRKGKTPALQMRTEYCDRIWTDPSGVLAEARAVLKGVKFDTFVSTGQSGSLALSLFGRAFRKNIFVVRKDADHQSSHSSLKWIGQLGTRWIFLDDFVSSGRTQTRVIEGVQAALDYARTCGEGSFETAHVGRYEYERGLYTPEEQWNSDYTEVKREPRIMRPTPTPVEEAVVEARVELERRERRAVPGNLYMSTLGEPGTLDLSPPPPLTRMSDKMLPKAKCDIPGCDLCAGVGSVF